MVYVANGLNFPDALAAGPAAARHGGPILLVQPGAVPPSTASELDRLDPDRIVVVGGTSQVSTTVLASLDPYTSGPVTREAGGGAFSADRYGTAAKVSNANFGPGVNVVYVANGLNFPDALAAGPAAARHGGPILLVQPGAIPPSTAAELDRLNPDRIVVVGGSSQVSAAVETALNAYDTGGGVTREAGGGAFSADRYGTAAKVTEYELRPRRRRHLRRQRDELPRRAVSGTLGRGLRRADPAGPADCDPALDRG